MLITEPFRNPKKQSGGYLWKGEFGERHYLLEVDMLFTRYKFINDIVFYLTNFVVSRIARMAIWEVKSENNKSFK